MSEKKEATHTAIKSGDGYRFIFYCDLSGARVCTTQKIYKGNTPEEALKYAWQTEGKKNFNKCHKCGKWVIDAVYNADVFECVDCAPFECEPRFCKTCGKKIIKQEKECPFCGNKLIYEGEGNQNDSSG